MGYRDHIRSLPGLLLSTLNPPFRTGTKRTDNVAWLDGLRGFAALLVYFHHFTGFTHENVWAIQRAYGWHENYYAICLPGLRIFFSGGLFAVAVFFAISGYVLSVAPLRLLHARDHLRLSTHLGSALPRRWVRLYFPVICTTFFFIISWHILDIQTSNPTSSLREPTLVREVAKWASNFNNQTYFFENEPFYRDNYNPHIWTIATEFRGSVVIFVVMLMFLAFAGYGAGVRLLAQSGLIFYFLFVVNGWYLALYLAGMLLCDLNRLAEHNELPQIPKPFSRLKLSQGSGSSWINYAALLLCVYLAGVPHIDDRQRLAEMDPGWHTLAWLASPSVQIVRWFFLFWAATLAMICIPRIPWLKAFFEGGFCQYLGRISFGLYLIHGPVIWTIGDRVYAAVGRPRSTAPDRIPDWINIFPLSGSGPLGLEINTVLPQLILLPFTLWLAGVVTKLFDEPSNKLSRWLFNPSRYDGYDAKGGV